MFWGLVLKTNKRYSQQVTKAFHVSQATLDLTTLGSTDGAVQVWVNIDDTDHLIANVGKATSHVILDLTFTEGESVAFYSKGIGTVHLSGYLIPEDDGFGEFGMGEEESEEEDVEMPEPTLSKKQAKEAALKASKKSIKQTSNAESDEDEDVDDESDDLDLEDLKEELEDDEGEDEEDSDEDDDEDDDEEDEDDDDDDDEDEEEDEIQAPPAKLAKLDKVKQNGLTNGKLPKKEEQKQKNQMKQEKQEQKQKNQQNQQQNAQQKSARKQLAGGVMVEDLRVGKGPEAKAGKKVSVYYEGRLKSNNSIFDSTKSGEGFKFQLGRGEVIRGWDIGIVGMKVGSRRRITCPPSAAYGNKGSPPVIPGNATLVFDVELRGVN